jgi:GNAT superfamily N-acetyltransferase
LWECSGVLIRERTEADVEAIDELAKIVHANDDYPVYLPGDIHSFIFAPDPIGAWVAERDGRVVGHVALHPRSSRAVMTLAQEATGLPATGLAVVARLLVSPIERRAGIGQLLLDVAAGRAVQLGLWPILDVVDGREAPLRLYEKAGWTCVGQVTVTFGQSGPIDEFVFLGPSPIAAHLTAGATPARGPGA